MTADKLRPIRVGAVSYLNSKPLLYGLREEAPFATLTLDLPSRLATGLAEERYDVALIPAIEYFRQPGCEIVSDACIAAHGPVWSVKLLFRTEPEKVRTLALDEGSRTSATLARILLHRRCGIEPSMRPLPIDADFGAADADAVLVIGDRAMHVRDEDYACVWDLAQAWGEERNLPFVFAMWVARPGVDREALAELEAALGRCRDAGLSQAEQIAAEEGPPLGLSPQAALDYFRKHLHFRLGRPERAGLAAFYEQAVALNLAPAGREVRFHDCLQR
ncbi:MAG TPA: menaquinone biosynthesis protein [Pirellulaceae bacterium]|jgi:chorismate dehydratase|nr:menaquinone biosynthesis protein [Pirellulaceae bacterium]